MCVCVCVCVCVRVCVYPCVRTLVDIGRPSRECHVLAPLAPRGAVLSSVISSQLKQSKEPRAHSKVHLQHSKHY